MSEILLTIARISIEIKRGGPRGPPLFKLVLFAVLIRSRLAQGARPAGVSYCLKFPA
jgi:hypothetical protein